MAGRYISSYVMTSLNGIETIIVQSVLCGNIIDKKSLIHVGGKCIILVSYALSAGAIMTTAECRELGSCPLLK